MKVWSLQALLKKWYLYCYGLHFREEGCEEDIQKNMDGEKEGEKVLIRSKIWMTPGRVVFDWYCIFSRNIVGDKIKTITVPILI